MNVPRGFRWLILAPVARKKDTTPKTIENRKARHKFSIVETLECGIVLVGTEVKSIRDGRVSLGEGYVRVESDPVGLYLHSVNISEYPPAGQMQHAPTRVRRLLAHKREILRLAREVDQKGVTLVPLKLYFKDGRAKLMIGLAVGKTKSDKRDALAEKESKREIDRAMSKRMRMG